jgi:hypothetical protein
MYALLFMILVCFTIIKYKLLLLPILFYDGSNEAIFLYEYELRYCRFGSYGVTYPTQTVLVPGKNSKKNLVVGTVDKS